MPQKITIRMTGTSHLYGVININLKSNYLPSNLTNSDLACTDLCQQILIVSKTSGSDPVLSTQIQYFPGTFSFSVSFTFGR